MNRSQCEVRILRKDFFWCLSVSERRKGNRSNGNPCAGDTHRPTANGGVAGDMWMQDVRHALTVSQSAW